MAKERISVDDWMRDAYKKVLEFLMSATPEELRNALREAGYEECTGINPDTLELRELTADEVQQMREEYNAL